MGVKVGSIFGSKFEKKAQFAGGIILICLGMKILFEHLGTDNDIVSKGIEDEVDKSLLRICMEKLNSREKNIMELRYGFKTGNEKTQKEVADMLGISQSYISRLEKKIIEINK